jgi:molybdopterin molybdotransferase
VVVDVSFGFAAGTVATLGLPGAPEWEALWGALATRVHDDEANRNDRFKVADALNATCGTTVFWGRPHQASYDHLVHLSKRDEPIPGMAARRLPRLRRCEELAGPGVIASWMLVGKGSVGGQVLTCLPALERLRRRLGDEVAVWPFQGIGDPGTPVVLAETWHGLFDWRAERGTVRDEQQVKGTLRALRSMGPTGIAELLAPPSLLAEPLRRRRGIVAEEGWTLGVR